ncbi:MAG: hypothetical protein WBB05_22085 [Mycolicibacterium fortuitum]|uniref:hypothetical protein n=1 Tax=Mycolicibacterium fortuitum TaxID=1766 RepID=UPI001130626E|nr:hypothetical protein [Mycolicibacterium fortuitum]TPW91497.1 hypothetical protein FKW78_27120 [Mycolicibacterium fortuitum]
MTAEAIVMNRSAVALAADSAVTVGGTARAKTFESANKLFELIKGSNIGVMVYSSAEINGTPWETVIKTFRRDHSTFQASHVEDYFDTFRDYLAKHTKLLKPADEMVPVMRLSKWLFGDVFDYLEEYQGRLTTAAGVVIKKAVREAVAEFCQGWEEHLDGKDNIPDLADRAALTYRRSFGDAVKHYAERTFTDLPLTAPLINRLVRLVFTFLTKEVRTPLDSGLVFAGFGTEDYFPKMVCGRVSARIESDLIIHERENAEVTVLEPAHLQTFAQDDPARGWIDGISKEVRGEIQGHWLNWVGTLPRRFRREIKSNSKLNLDPADAKEIEKAVFKLAREQLNEFFSYMQDYEDENFKKPMISSISLLPKDELGLLAESLVNITSLKQRMSIFDANTVGGAIDVALISIGDGFVWLNRKHYFKPELNPTWNLTHGARITVRKSATEEEI